MQSEFHMARSFLTFKEYIARLGKNLFYFIYEGEPLCAGAILSTLIIFSLYFISNIKKPFRQHFERYGVDSVTWSILLSF